MQILFLTNIIVYVLLLHFISVEKVTKMKTGVKIISV